MSARPQTPTRPRTEPSCRGPDFRTGPDWGRSPNPPLLNSPPPQLSSFSIYLPTLVSLGTNKPGAEVPFISGESLFCPPPPYPSLPKPLAPAASPYPHLPPSLSRISPYLSLDPGVHPPPLIRAPVSNLQLACVSPLNSPPRLEPDPAPPLHFISAQSPSCPHPCLPIVTAFPSVSNPTMLPLLFLS